MQIPSCDSCADLWGLYYETAPIASNDEEHVLLLRCPVCRSLYKFHPEEHQAPAKIDDQTASGQAELARLFGSFNG